MARKTVTIKIAFDGSVEAETHGMKGEECLAYIEKLEELLDAQTVDSSYTSEFYETASTETAREWSGLQQVQDQQANSGEG